MNTVDKLTEIMDDLVKTCVRSCICGVISGDHTHHALACNFRLLTDIYEKVATLRENLNLTQDGTLVHVATAMATRDGTPYVAIMEDLEWSNYAGKPLYARRHITADVVVKVTITAAMVNELRAATDAGMMACKAALEAANGDMMKASEYLKVYNGKRG